MTKKNNGTKIKILTWACGIVFLAGVMWAITNSTAETLDKHSIEDKIRDDKAHEDIDELEKGYVSISKDIEQINKSMTKQEKLMTEIVKALPK